MPESASQGGGVAKKIPPQKIPPQKSQKKVPKKNLGGMYLVLGGSAPGGVIPACTEADTPSPGDRITDACKNITLAKLRCGR